MDCLFDPGKLISATLIDDTITDDQTSVDDAGCKYRLRPLSSNDHALGYMDLLSQLTKTGNVTRLMFTTTFDSMRKDSGTYFIIVIEDTVKKCIVATGSLIIEKKFIHQCGHRGRIEDIVVHSDYRGKRFGKIIVQRLIALSRVLKCYKISLECKDSNVSWYSSMGFVREPGNSNFMQMRLIEDDEEPSP
ncbi:probable glucosamine 6-phosphate N-acetyltransferase [Aphis gossypii]|uniref:probable glucosamine 6-phosphate N-acetyltransferase n=1 Tax=Aphis gossypii TaxID=80765 RepID=UPI002158A344|nr:probable glucosamine 6-phosphate N-acetyltransferase [Aphis gossypii]